MAAVNAAPEDVILMRRGARERDQLISAEVADLLRLFSQPLTIVDAVVQFAEQSETPAEEILEEAFPAFQSLVERGFLVPVTETEEERPTTLDIGTVFAERYEVAALLRKMEDTEVYRLRAIAGTAADTGADPAQGADAGAEPSDFVLKICHRATRRMVNLISREVAILKELADADYCPTYVEHGVHEDRPFVIMTYLDAETSQSLTDRLLNAGGPEAVVQISKRIMSVFADLGRRGIMHGDVHPGNVMVSKAGAVFVIDFGQSRLLKGKLSRHTAGRGAVDIYYEPELAAALAKGQETFPPAVEQGQQFTVAAMLYRLLTGQAHVRLPALRSELFPFLADQVSRPFPQSVNRRVAKLEPVLKRALSSAPEERFPSFAAFHSAFDEALATEAPRCVAGHAELANRYFETLSAPDKRFLSNGFLDPWCTLNNGMIGVSFAYQRLAELGWAHRGLALADAWLIWAEQMASAPQAFTSRDREIRSDTVGRVSPFHTVSGLHYARSCLAAQTGDVALYGEAIKAFASSIDAPCLEWDLTLGWAGVTLALAFMVAKGQKAGFPDTALSPAKALLHERIARQESWLQAQPAPAELTRDVFLGVAHGPLGQLHAAILGHQVLGTTPGDICVQRLEQLADCAVRMDDMVIWPRMGGGFSYGYGVHAYSSWCNGSAGFAMVYSHAAKVFDRADFRDIALGAGLHALRNDIQYPDLCCGTAGTAYAMLSLYRATGDALWVSRAQDAADRALEHSRSYEPSGALYKGELGVMLLQLDITDPENARMPCFEM
ncbi:hypothetical protein CKO11_03435 [Rhodobacter sp. TJ_12]|nr:hypothetical protein [Rhodobacter sp. TJ_12]